jgi:hypothetical protein
MLYKKIIKVNQEYHLSSGSRAPKERDDGRRRRRTTGGGGGAGSTGRGEEAHGRKRPWSWRATERRGSGAGGAACVTPLVSVI